MLKWLGLLLMFFSCGMTGQYGAARLRSRVGYLRQWQRGVLALATEISYSLLPLPQALRESGKQAQGEAGAFLQRVGERLERGFGSSAEQLWQEEAEMLREQVFLQPQDVELIKDMALGLGLSDRGDQLKRLELCRARLAEAEKEAAAEYAKMARVYRVLGWGGGAMIALLFV